MSTTADALAAALFSPTEHDSNCEPANVVDGLFAIARSLQAIAEAIEATRSPFGAVVTNGRQARPYGDD